MPPEAEFVQGDVVDRWDMSRALAGMDYVVHLAAYPDYMPDFSQFVHTNTESAALIFELIVSDPQRYQVKKIIFASSQAVCGEGRYLCPNSAGGASARSIPKQLSAVGTQRSAPVTDYPAPPHAIHVPGPRSVEQLIRGDWEIHCPVCGSFMQPLLIDEATASPGTTYGISKYAIELLADRLGRRYGIPTACMRYTYVQGPRNSFYNAYSGIAGRFALRLLHGLPPVAYEDGLQMRD